MPAAAKVPASGAGQASGAGSVPGVGVMAAGRSAAADLRAELLANVRRATARAARCQDADLAAELASLGPPADQVIPTVEELYGLVPDSDCGPPDGAEAWLADLPWPLLAEYLAATGEQTGPEPIAAGRLPRETGDGCGFAAGGVADDLPPGPVLAGLASDVSAAGLGRLSDDELIGVLRAARRLASWSAALELAAVADLATRRDRDAEAAGDLAPAEHVGDEIAAALTLTGRAADRLLDLAMALRRLPGTMAALAAGHIDRARAAVIADEVTGLDDEHAAAVECAVLGNAPGQTTGQLRAATRRAVLSADPAAARERKERAQHDARVEKWDEHAGTAALAGRDLPPAEVLAADHNLTALAAQLKAAGVGGTLDQLRARVYLALLTGQPVASLLPPTGLLPHTGPASGTAAALGLGTPGTPAPSDPSETRPASGPASTEQGQALSGPGLPGSGLGLSGPGLPGSVNLTIPLATWLGLSDVPGDVAGHGPLDAGDSRDLATRLAQRPGNRWCITLTSRRGRPIAHGCARAGPPGGPGPPGDSGPPGGPGLPANLVTWLAGITIRTLETGDCTHLRESAAYRPPPSLQHLIAIRQCTCSFPGCRRSAVRCDKDHTVPYDQGGRTCECNLAGRVNGNDAWRTACA